MAGTESLMRGMIEALEEQGLTAEKFAVRRRGRRVRVSIVAGEPVREVA